MGWRYTIWDEMRRMQEQMDSLFDAFFGNTSFLGSQSLLEGPMNRKGDLTVSNYKQPISDIYETDTEIVAEIEMPGLDKKDIKVQVSDQGIEVKAETKAETKYEDKKKGMFKLERNYSGFYRQFSLPSNVDTNNASAEYKDGVLKIVVPKLKVEEQKKKLLDIK